MTALQEAGLPVDDLGNDVPRRWWMAYHAGDWYGMVALERLGEVGLLRSLLVRDGVRHAGAGRVLVATVEAAAADAALDAIYLLTTDADGYFSRLGYVLVDRDDVPPAVRDTTQFSALCPASAKLMCKRLRP